MNLFFFKVAQVTDFVFGAIEACFKIPEIENPVDEGLRE